MYPHPEQYICDERSFQEAVNQLIKDAIRAHATPEDAPEYKARREAESAAYEALCAACDTYCARRVAQALRQL